MDVEFEESTTEYFSSDSCRFFEGCVASSFSLAVAVLRLAVPALPKKREEVRNDEDEVDSSLRVL